MDVGHERLIRWAGRPVAASDTLFVISAAAMYRPGQSPANIPCRTEPALMGAPGVVDRGRSECAARSTAARRGRSNGSRLPAPTRVACWYIEHVS